MFEITKTAFSKTFNRQLFACAIILVLTLCISTALLNLNYAAPVSKKETGQAKKLDRLWWEGVKSTTRQDISRTKVPGGWFIIIENHVQSQTRQNLYEMQNLVGAAFFYPDPNHSWDGTSLPD
jgi:hypothetical protein